jgi:Peptidase C13 family
LAPVGGGFVIIGRLTSEDLRRVTTAGESIILLGSQAECFWPMCTRLIMTSKCLISRLIAPLIALLVALAAIHAPLHAAEDLRKVTVVSFGLFGDQGVFRREATGAAQIVGSRFGHGSVIVKYNTKRGGGATVETLATTLQAEAKKMNGESDILFLILTSHGSRDGLAVTAGRRTEILTPSTLAEMLDQTGVRYKVVIISACYSGIFIPRLANADTLVITAADADHASFGCEDKAAWTYFGDAFFNIALRQTKTLKDAFLLARTLIANRELRQGFDPSHPQMAGGANVESLLPVRP